MRTRSRGKTGQGAKKATQIIQEDLLGMDDVLEPNNSLPSSQRQTQLPVNNDENPLATEPERPLPTKPSAPELQIPPMILTIEALQSIVQSLIQNEGASPPAPSSQLAVSNMTFIQDFMSMNPPVFDGSSDNFIVAEDWIADLEAIFDFIQCQDDQRVRSAIFLLKGNARHWWKSIERCDHSKTLKDLFFDRYCPMDLRHEKECEFYRLTQGNMTVYQYERKFEALSRFASPHIANIEVKMMNRFINGLRDEVRQQLVVHLHRDPNFALMRRCARLMDKATPRQEQGCASNQKRKFQHFYSQP